MKTIVEPSSEETNVTAMQAFVLPVPKVLVAHFFTPRSEDDSYYEEGFEEPGYRLDPDGDPIVATHPRLVLFPPFES